MDIMTFHVMMMMMVMLMFLTNTLRSQTEVPKGQHEMTSDSTDGVQMISTQNILSSSSERMLM